MRVLPAGDRALLLELPDARVRRAVDAALRDDPPPGLIDQVPAATTVLLRFDGPDRLAAAVRNLPDVDAVGVRPPVDAGEPLVVRTSYDGEDLDEVARLFGTDAAGLVAWHTSQVFTVEFGGFLPGFGYLGGPVDAPEVPRRRSPRTRIPAGAVGLAGRWTGIYPQASPGGWQIIGRTRLPVWDVHRDPPGLLTPGRRVRFVDAGPLSDGPASDPTPASAGSGGVGDAEIVAVGPLALIEDLGRHGLGALGVPAGGAADRVAHRLANRLVGNPEDAATIEVLLGRLELRAISDLLVAATGAPAPLAVSGRPVAWAAPVHVPAGARITIGVPDHGVRSYLAVRGGVAADRVLGSRSGDPTTGLGPPPLRVGDLLRVGSDPGYVVRSSDLTSSAHRWGGVTLRVVLGPADDWFDSASIARLTTTTWRVSSHSDRVGVRLDGGTLQRRRPGERPSEGVVRGAVQVPASGEPLIFLADHPTTGGYPVIGVVVDDDTDLLAQCRPGDTVRMRVVPRPW